jgi:hypothetical protein
MLLRSTAKLPADYVAQAVKDGWLPPLAAMGTSNSHKQVELLLLHYYYESYMNHGFYLGFSIYNCNSHALFLCNAFTIITLTILVLFYSLE